MDRSEYPTRLTRLGLEEGSAERLTQSPAERVAMVWTLTLQAWAFMEGGHPESRLRRDVVRVVRGGR